MLLDLDLQLVMSLVLDWSCIHEICLNESIWLVHMLCLCLCLCLCLSLSLCLCVKLLILGKLWLLEGQVYLRS